QPDLESPLIDVAPARARLWAYGVLLGLLGLYLVHVYAVLPWQRTRRPFMQAWRALERMPTGASGASGSTRRDSFQKLHEALNEAAGEVVFERDIDGFVRRHPRFVPLRPDLESFFERSRREFFGVPSDRAEDLPWLMDFSRRCRDVERGAA
ncbi:MAG: hypothetical protein ABIV63_16765, partial [Caldimonas sp.]